MLANALHLAQRYRYSTLMTKVEELRKLAFAYAHCKEERLRKRDLKLAHYTSADAAVKIILNKSIWLRNASNMNDYLEIQHGSDCLKTALQEHSTRFRAALEPLGEGYALSILESLNSANYNARNHTYLTSLSEHQPNDTMGRLSMWRAYGGPIAGVALVFNPIFLGFDSSDLATWTSPILYGDSTRFSAEFLRVVQNIEANRELLLDVGQNEVRNILFDVLQFAILSAKHKGFQEEREWRLIHSPHDMASEFVRPTFASIGGIPEQVYHLPLEDPIKGQRPDFSLDKLIHRVIIGPCRNPILIGNTIKEALREAGVNDPAERIHLSLIPLRQQG